MIKNMSRTSLKLLLGLAFLCFFGSGSASAADGKAIFKQNCAVCHTLTDQKLTGPGLAGIAGKVPGGDWLFKWVKNNEKMIKSGDEYAVKIFKENGNASMTVFEGTLSDDDVKAVVEFIKNPPVEVKPEGQVASGDGGAVSGGGNQGGTDPLYIILAVIVILALLIGVLRAVRMSLQNVVNRKEGKEEVPSVPFLQEAKDWCSRHRRFLGVCGIVIVFLGMKGCWDGLWDIGVYYNEETKMGYKPEQPIKFSHKIHAGDNAIACQYCHNSVEKSRHAGIPTVNVCMNCHKAIHEGPTTGKTEIAKIHFAAGFNTKTGNYDLPQNPIKWIKVHNLPDHVYFNHSQHVVVGKQDCANCHGDVKKMTVAEQQSPLTMGWCIDCHRKTDVAMDGNPYYDKLHAYMKEKYKDQHLKTFTVSQVGGIECGKCHY
jgi:mono/diheme cytochrome c family protein